MITISHEIPISMLDESRAFNDYDYALVHLFDIYPEYKEYYYKSVAEGRHVLLDNSIFELGHSYDPIKFAETISDMQPTEYVIPDVLEDAYSTVDNVIQWSAKYRNQLPGKSIGVVQGRTYEEIVYCHRNIEKLVDKIAISFDYSFYSKAYPHPNKLVSYMMGRVMLISQMLADGIIDTNKRYHLLGASLPQEFLYYRDMNFIETVDTSNPVVAAIKGIRYKDWGLLHKESQKLADLIETKEIDRQLLEYNTNKFREFVNG